METYITQYIKKGTDCPDQRLEAEGQYFDRIKETEGRMTKGETARRITQYTKSATLLTGRREEATRCQIKHENRKPIEFWNTEEKERRRRRKKLTEIRREEESRKAEEEGRVMRLGRGQGGGHENIPPPDQERTHTEPKRTRAHEPKEQFDSTKGYPGEGPTQERLKVATLNVAGLNDTTNQKMGGLLR